MAICRLELQSAQAQGVQDHGNGTERHGERADDRAEKEAEGGVKNAGRNRNADRVVGERKCQILANVAHGRPAQDDGACNAREVSLHQRDSGALDRNFGSRPHGDADGGLGQSRSIVHAIAGHSDNASVGREFFDDAVLVLRQNIGFDFFDAELAGHRAGRRLAVPRQHHDPNALFPQGIERGLRRRLDRVGNGDDAAWFVIDREKQGRRPVPAQLVRLVFKIAKRDAEVRHKLRISERDKLTANSAGDAFAGDRGEGGGFLDRSTAFLCGVDDGSGKGVFAGSLKTGCQRQDFGFRQSRGRQNGRHPWLAFGKRAGFVDDQRIDFFHALRGLRPT